MAWLKSGGRLGAAACLTVEPDGCTSKMLQWQPLEASLTRVHRLVQDDRQLGTQRDHLKQPLFSGEQGLVLVFDLRCPCSGHTTSRHGRPSRNGTARIRNHRNVPVRSSQASLEFSRFTTVEEGTPVIHQSRQVLGMDRGQPAPAGRVL